MPRKGNADVTGVTPARPPSMVFREVEIVTSLPAKRAGSFFSHLCPPRSVTVSLTMAVLFVCCAAVLCTAAGRPDGAALYQKHCVSCHPDGSKLKLDIPLLGTLRTPPVGMPAFGQEKLSDRDVQAVGEYLRPGAPGAPKTEPAPQAPAKAGKSSKEKKSWMKGFGTSE